MIFRLVALAWCALAACLFALRFRRFLAWLSEYPATSDGASYRAIQCVVAGATWIMLFRWALR